MKKIEVQKFCFQFFVALNYVLDHTDSFPAKKIFDLSVPILTSRGCDRILPNTPVAKPFYQRLELLLVLQSLGMLHRIFDAASTLS